MRHVVIESFIELSRFRKYALVLARAYTKNPKPETFAKYALEVDNCLALLTKIAKELASPSRRRRTP